jgi:phytoene dehydrogenase-like protein
VIKIGDDAAGKTIEIESGEVFHSEFIAANCAPQVLAKILGTTAPKYVKGSQLKINMLLKKLPRLKSGADPVSAFAGTFHIDESYAQCETAYQEAAAGKIPTVIPAEMYCHTLTDPSILGQSHREQGYQTLTLFALHTPADLFEKDNEGVKAEMLRRIFTQLNEYLVDPIELCLAFDENGKLCVEVKSPQDLEKDVALPGGNIFHTDLHFPFSDDAQITSTNRWGVGTGDAKIFICGAGALRGGGVSGIGGHNAAMAILGR